MRKVVKPGCARPAARGWYRIRGALAVPLGFCAVGATFGLVLAFSGLDDRYNFWEVVSSGLWQYAAVGAFFSLPFLLQAAIRNRNERALERSVASAICLLGIAQYVAAEYLRFGPPLKRVLIQKSPGWIALYLGLCLAVFLVGGKLLRVLFTRTFVARAIRAKFLLSWALFLVLLQGLSVALAPGARAWEKKVASSTSQDAPNVLLIVADTLRADHLNGYGYRRNRTSPFLDELAKQGALFERAIANGNWTLPSHASVFTGRHLFTHGVGIGGANLEDARSATDRLPTLAQLLAARGYDTAAISNNEILVDRTILRGFRTVLYPPAFAKPKPRTRNHPLKIPKALSHFCEKVLWNRFVVGAPNPGDGGAAQTQRHVAKWLDRRDPDTPFFLFLNYMESHNPYAVPEYPNGRFGSIQRSGKAIDDPLMRLLLDPYDPANPFSTYLVESRMRAYNADPSTYDARDLAYLRDRYDESIAYLDGKLRDLFALLKERGLLENTLILFTSDHGEALGEQNNFLHARTLQEELVHVPLIVLDPRRPAERGKRYTRRVQLLDLLPTVLRATGTHYPVAEFGPLPGTDLFDSNEREPVVTEWCFWPDPDKPWAHLAAFRDRARRLDSNKERDTMTLNIDRMTDPAVREDAVRWKAFFQEYPLHYRRVYTTQEDLLKRSEIPMLPGTRNRQLRDFLASAGKALYFGNWKYCLDSNGNERLYDLAADPGETDNLARKRSDVLADLHKRLERWRASVRPAGDGGGFGSIPYVH